MKIINLFSVDNIFVAAGKKFNMFLSLMDSYLSNSNNLRTLSIILMMFAIVLFLILIVFIYIKSMSALLKASQNKHQNKEDFAYNSLITQNLDAEELEKIRQEELEKELTREMEKAVAEQASREEQKRIASERKRKQQEDEQILVAEAKMPELKKRMKVAKKDTALDLDWKKGKLKKMETFPEPPDIPLQYQQNKKQLSELLGLIIDMLGRNVDDLKIAQTIMFRNMYHESEEAVLQTIDAIKDFIALCLNGQFKPLHNEKKLPKEDKALYNLALGDSSLALALLEALMDDNINKASSMQAGNKRDVLFALTSNYAQIFGALAAVNDIHLATGAFELAIELFPQNINAWNRMGDMYKLAENESQAIKAYQNVLALADEDINTRQSANAEKMLAQFYYAQGDSLQAAKYYNKSKGYYDSIGINRRLDRQEVEIIEIIESHQNEDWNDTINKLLSNQSLRQYSFA